MEALDHLGNDNSAGEYYLGDVLPLLREQGHRVVAHMATDPNVNLGVNNRADLAVVAAEARRQINERHMLAGVTIVDPAATWIDADVEIAADATIEPGTLAARRDAHRRRLDHRPPLDADRLDRRRAGTRRSTPTFRTPTSATWSRSARSPTCVPAPSSRPAPRPAPSSRSRTRPSARRRKVPHLSYIGDADVGAGANVGAGSITANYDGRDKHRTKIGEGARISVNTSLVAPVTVGDGAYTGAGAVIREDVPDGALGVSSNEQRNIEDYADRRAKADEAGGAEE